MSLLTLDSVSAATADGRSLFSGLTLALGRETVGLVGRNGAGKSTLLAMIAGTAEPAAGSIVCQARVGMLRQIQPAAGVSGADALGIDEALARLDRLDRGLGTAEDMAEADWMLPTRLAEALAEVGLDGLDLARPCASLSGGERTRLGIARLLVEAPELLLLDEPTNNLDKDGRAAIAALLEGWRGGAVVASHDRMLLEHVDRIVHLSPVGVTLFGGGWSAFAAAREAERMQAEADLTRADQALKAQKLAIQRQAERKARRDKSGSAWAAKGGESRLFLGGQRERAENSGGRDNHLAARLVGEAETARAEADARVERLTPLHIDLPRTGLPAERMLLAFDKVVLERDGRRIFGPLSFTLRGPRRIALAGRNGAGKTSLLHLATGAIDPSSGSVQRRPGAITMLDQHAALLDPMADLVTNLRRRHPALNPNEAHAVLARFAFRNRDALRAAGTLSGGERLRAGLAIATAGSPPPQLLILDEPTNHLDIEAIETLEASLRDYDGALLIVSHDAAFLDAIGIEERIELG
ncbi:ABC-F family ATP-binding cassette domain-containing protein [Flavisphingomonas formosensis]|uniref:ABC-F family ATP-binding cassette domain-containing protein n=1 Tax=Flavisphingomonas formosensis TaxID=861534 RepID=UPI0012F89F3F|nr:ABC-F family ATP-binding cassette domain-containing protein [Sphingomonas formosensis]